MLVFWHNKCHQNIDVEQAGHAKIYWREAINVFDGQCRRAGAPRKDRHATVETHVGLRDSTQQRSDEVVNRLAGLAREMSEPFFQRTVLVAFGMPLLSHDVATGANGLRRHRRPPHTVTMPAFAFDEGGDRLGGQKGLRAPSVFVMSMSSLSRLNVRSSPAAAHRP
jgi:hypothetical protein